MADQTAELETGESQLQLESSEASGGEGTQLQVVNGDEEKLLSPPDLRMCRLERRQTHTNTKGQPDYRQPHPF